MSQDQSTPQLTCDEIFIALSDCQRSLLLASRQIVLGVVLESSQSIETSREIILSALDRLNVIAAQYRLLSALDKLLVHHYYWHRRPAPTSISDTAAESEP